MLKVKARITLIALRIRVPGEFGQSWARDLYQALTLLWLIIDRVPDLKFERIYVERVRVWKGLKESKERSSVFYY